MFKPFTGGFNETKHTCVTIICLGLSRCGLKHRVAALVQPQLTQNCTSEYFICRLMGNLHDRDYQAWFICRVLGIPQAGESTNHSVFQ
jgi:hypothetical protein